MLSRRSGQAISPVSGWTLAAGKAAGFLLSCLLPQQCRFCHAPLLGNERPFLCGTCLGLVGWLDARACRLCGFPAGPHAELGKGCSRCRRRELPLTGAAGVARYAGPARSLVMAYKFGGETCLAEPLAGMMAERFLDRGFPDCDFLIPVPLHPRRVKERGFDQASLLARRANRLGIGRELREDLLRRGRPTRPQSLLNAAERRRNTEGAFGIEGSLKGRSVVLLDDVMTTGATMGECARVCREAGASRVYALVFAR